MAGRSYLGLKPIHAGVAFLLGNGLLACQALPGRELPNTEDPGTDSSALPSSVQDLGGDAGVALPLEPPQTLAPTEAWQEHAAARLTACGLEAQELSHDVGCAASPEGVRVTAPGGPVLLDVTADGLLVNGIRCASREELVGASIDLGPNSACLNADQDWPDTSVGGGGDLTVLAVDPITHEVRFTTFVEIRSGSRLLRVSGRGDLLRMVFGDGRDDIRLGALERQVNVNGGAGDDYIEGTPGDDALAGSAGNDTFVAMDGNDTVLGGSGDDLFRSGPSLDGSDIFAGDEGADTIDYSERTVSVEVYLSMEHFSGVVPEEGMASGQFDEGDLLYEIENARGGSGNDRLFGTSVRNEIAGGLGGDLINAGDGDDVISGEGGEDRASCGTGLQDTCQDGERECATDCESR